MRLLRTGRHFLRVRDPIDNYESTHVTDVALIKAYNMCTHGIRIERRALSFSDDLQRVRQPVLRTADCAPAASSTKVRKPAIIHSWMSIYVCIDGTCRCHL